MNADNGSRYWTSPPRKYAWFFIAVAYYSGHLLVKAQPSLVFRQLCILLHAFIHSFWSTKTISGRVDLPMLKIWGGP